MTTLSATFQPGTTSAPARVLLQVAGAPVLTPNYTSNFTTTNDGWTGSAGTYILNASNGALPNCLELQGADATTSTFSRTVTGLTVGQTYSYSMMAYSWRGSISLGVSGMAFTAFTTPVGRGPVSYSFTATATSHVIQAKVKPSPAEPAINGAFDIDTVKVIRTTGWLGTTIRRTDANGTNVVVREGPGGQDATGTSGSGTMTVTDYEQALVWPITYTVTDGNGGTATASPARTITPVRTNVFWNPEATTNSTYWSQAPGTGGTAALTRRTDGNLVIPETGQVVTTYVRQTWSAITTGALSSTGIVFGSSATDSITLTPGQSHRVSVYVRSSVVGRTAQFTITSHDAAGGNQIIEISGVASQQNIGDGWTRLTSNAFVPAAGQVRGYVRVYNVGGPLHVVGDTMDATAAQVEVAPAVGAYFSGDSPGDAVTGNRWTGTPGASTSEQGPYGTPAVWLSLPTTANPAVPTPPSFVQATMVTAYDETSSTNGSMHTIVGRADPIANPGPLALRSGTVQVFCPTYADAKAIRTMLANGDVAMLRQPSFPGMDMYFVGTAVSIAPEEPSKTQRWMASVTYQEVATP